MSILGFLKSIVSAEALGDETIRTQENCYQQVKNRSPHEDPHVWLAEVWLARMRLRGVNINESSSQMMAMAETLNFSCLPEPKNIRALGLYFLYKEHPEIINQFPKFGQEFDALMAPILTGRLQIEAEYKKRNPKLSTNGTHKT